MKWDSEPGETMDPMVSFGKRCEHGIPVMVVTVAPLKPKISQFTTVDQNQLSAPVFTAIAQAGP